MYFDRLKDRSKDRDIICEERCYCRVLGGVRDIVNLNKPEKWCWDATLGQALLGIPAILKPHLPIALSRVCRSAVLGSSE